MTKKIVILCVIILCSVTIGYAGWESDVKNAFNAGDSSRAFRIVKAEAESGNAEAQNFLGTMYINAVSVPKDETEGLALLLVAAENGSQDAKRNADFMKTRMNKENIDKASEVAKTHRLRRNK